MSLQVLHVLDHSWPILSGYSVRSQGLIAAQQRLGLRPSVLTGPLHQLDDRGAQDTTLDGIVYRRTPIPRGVWGTAIAKRWPVARELAVVLLLQGRIQDMIRTEHIDVVHAHSPALCGVAAWRAVRKAPIPFVYEIRAFWEDAAVDQQRTTRNAVRYRLSQNLESFVAHRAGAVVGIASHILDQMRARGVSSERLFHVPNGVDAERFSPLPRDEQLAAQLAIGAEPVFGFFGSLYRYEGISWLVRAMAELQHRGLRFKFLIGGEGEDASAIEAAIRETNASGYIRRVGKIPHEEILRYYSLCDILVYPREKTRLTELVTPLKPLEAMAQAKAVLASNVGGIRELVNPEITGVLFEPGDVDDFCRQAKRLIEQSSLRRKLGERARLHVGEEKDWKTLARRYKDIYDSTIQRARIGPSASSSSSALR